MRYGVFQIDQDNRLTLITRFDSIEEAESFAKTGVNMIILEFHS
jgi:hypothetical protein